MPDDADRLERVRAYYAEDLFAVEAAGITIDEARQGASVVSMQVRPIHRNAKGGIMGGALFTMADFASSVADWQPDQVNMTVDSSMQFLSGLKGTRCIATATAERRGRTMGFYRVHIEDDLGTKLAIGTFTYLHRPRQQHRPS